MKQPDNKWQKPAGQPGPNKPQHGGAEQEKKPQNPFPHDKERHKK